MKAPAVRQGKDAHHALAAFNSVADDGSVLAVDHEDGLINAGAADPVAEPRKWIAAKLMQAFESLGMDGAGILVIGQLDALQLFIQRAEQKPAVDGRLQGRHQKAVVGSGVVAYSRGRGIAAQAIGQQPLAA